MAAGLACVIPAGANGIIVNYDSSVPAAAQTAFSSVVAAYNAMFTFNAPVVIDVQFDNTSLGSSSTYIGTTSYASWRSQMIAASLADPQNAYLAAAVATLPATDPIGNGNVILTFADALELGYSVPSVPFDSLLSFSNSVNFEYNGVPTVNEYDFQNVAEHELDEALGIGSALTGIPDGGSLSSSYYSEDYFRYASSGARLLSTNAGDVVYFSYNGTTDVAQFNQTNTAGDRNDWIYGNYGCPPISPGPYIQDSIGCPDTAVALTAGSPESIVLQTLGYDLAAPEPAPPAFVCTGLGAMFLLRRRARRVR